MNSLFVFTVCIFVGAVLLFLWIIKREKDLAKKQAHVLHDYEQVLEKARTRARRVLNMATDEAITVYKHAHITNENILEELDHILQESLAKHLAKSRIVSEELLTAYKKSLTSLQTVLLQKAQKTMTEETVVVDGSVTSFADALHKAFDDLPQTLQKTTQQALTQVENDVALYKKAQLQKVDQQIQAIFLATYQDLLGKGMTMTLTTTLVAASLEKAKEEGVFASWQNNG